MPWRPSLERLLGPVFACFSRGLHSVALSTLTTCALSALIITFSLGDRKVVFTDQHAVVQLQLTVENKKTVTSAVLVDREDSPQGVVLYFLTSDSLVRDRSVTPSPSISDYEGEMEVQASAPSIAVLRILTESSSLVPARVTFESPDPGAPFFIVSHDAAGAQVIIPQHIGMMSGGFAAGDVDMRVAACVGAPAFSEKGVFGIVSECETNRPPLITLLSAEKGLVLRLVPGLDVRQGTVKVGRGD